MKKILFIFLFINCLNCFGQDDIYKIKIPKTLEKSFTILDKTLTKEEIQIIKNSKEDSISNHTEFKNGTDFFHAWKIYDGSKLTKHLNKKGIHGSNNIYETILITYHRYLNNKPIDLNQRIEIIKEREEKEHLEFLNKIKQDSLNGVYIPKNIKECFRELDSILSNDDIQSIKKLENRDETIMFHHGLGTWLRNNWGLWGGSRLQQYFIERKINHPDSMSSTILEYYYDWLNGENSGWEKFDKK